MVSQPVPVYSLYEEMPAQLNFTSTWPGPETLLPLPEYVHLRMNASQVCTIPTVAVYEDTAHTLRPKKKSSHKKKFKAFIKKSILWCA